MKVLIYFESADKLKKSGIGRAMRHQIEACKEAGIEYTINKNDTYDIVHINTLFEKSKKLLKRCKKKHIPVIVHGHSTFEDFKNSFAFWRLMSVYFYHEIRVMYRGADAMITPTNYSKKLIESYGFNRPVYAISNGIKLDDYQYDEEAYQTFIYKFNIKENEKVVMGVGLPFQRKGLQDFIEVARSFPNIKFILIMSLFSQKS